jgi:pimeloyl-ACP methyl ester carboxylesterase
MSQSSWSRISSLPVTIALLLGGDSAAGQATAKAEAIDHLNHPPGTVTGRAGSAHVERRGKGPVLLVLIAGAPFGWRAWGGFMARNEERYSMLAVTPAGYDGTPPPAMPEKGLEDYAERPWTAALMADLVALIEKEVAAPSKLGPAVVVGHHLMGDYYALRLAYEHPELVRAVVSVAGLGSFPVGQGSADSETRARFVRDNRAPFFRSVSQETWNANTFPASSLSKDPERGRALFEAQIAVPIATQVRYYLEYMTDELEPGMELVQVPVLALQVKPQFGFDNLSQPMKDQLVKKFGSLEEAKKQVHFGGPWDGLASRAKPGLVRLQEMPDAGIFLMEDAPAAFDQALAQFVSEIAAQARPAPGPVTEK